MTRVYVPRDSAARSIGADEVAVAILSEAAVRGVDIELVRNGSRGLLWAEPLVEVVTDDGRVGYAGISADRVSELFDAGFLTGGEHSSRLGVVDELPWLKDQQRVTFARMGIIDPLDLDDYEAHGGLRGLRRALELGAEATVEEVLASGLRGRGGAGFPAGIKWRTVMQAQADQKYIACNADEGDSGTFADRMLMEGDPFTLIEGMTIAGVTTGATVGYIYSRSEYPDANNTVREALAVAYERGLLGADVLGSGKSFDLRLRVGAGAYICGEETAMLDSLEGRRGMVRAKPPIPALEGLFGKPTLVNNVMSLGARRSGGWPVGFVRPGGQTRCVTRLRVNDHRRWNGWTWWNRRIRRDRRYVTSGSVCDGVLLQGVLWQVHTVSNWRGARGGNDRQNSRGC